MSILRRIFSSFRRQTYYVGRDLEGNRYFERPSLVDDPRPKRSVEYADSGDMWKYVGGQRRLVVQWSSWLTHTRPDPPTLDELQADLIRQERIRRNVALLEARDREDERLRLASVPQRMAPSVATPDPAAVVEEPAKPAPTRLPKMPSSTKSDEPESWTPHTAARGR
ncbi:hypothetical protein FB45DRAFT_909836 [Roridomyces roridus]|uniref:NADH dehydrogenase [ubiquinone] 1 alpha subcomplex subunit n=1 Tax=Roridomyces roridus TaxID=1738132 RepID=A0AAD7BZE4_9AGAR|nr:hypothetical protein FB45DRAFT_909836 [Roridomyces roridus]